MPFDLTGEQTTVLVIVVVAFGLLISERLRPDIVAGLIVLSLFFTSVLEAPEALAGLSSEPAVVVAAIFVLTAGLSQTGVSDGIGTWVARLAGSGLNRAIIVIMPSVAVLSAFTHHVTTTAVMLPITLKLADERKIPASKLLMPLSFAASLGTTITIIGAPAFLIASDVLKRNGAPGLGIFSIAPIGIALSLAGTAIILLAGRLLLPERRGSEDTSSRFRLDDYFTEVAIQEGSRLEGMTVDAVEADDRLHFRVVGWIRDGHRLNPPYGEQTIKAGDILLVLATPEQIVAFRQESGHELHPVAQYGDDASITDRSDADLPEVLVQAVIAPTSDLAGRTLAEVNFRRRYGAVVIALWRQEGWLREQMAQVRLRAGDVLVLQGDQDALSRVSDDRSFQMIVPFQGEAQLRTKAPVAAIIMAATVVGAAFTEVQMAALAGALAMVMTGCLTARQAYRAIDARIYVFIAGAIPLGAAMEKTELSGRMGSGLQQALNGWNETLILLTIFAVVAVLTQFMSDAATTAIFAPVAVALAQALGRPPEPYVVTVAMAAVAAFLTPIGHHGNLLIYGPGGYKFVDFVRAGTPLTVVVALIVAFLAPIVW